MKLTRIENSLYGKNSIKFGAAEEKPKEETKPSVDDDDDDEYEDESFWARNKGTIAALGAIGAAGVAIYAIRRGKTKMKSSTVKPLEETAQKVDIYTLQRQFSDELARASDDKEIGLIIKRAMGHENQELRGNMLSDLVLGGGSVKYVNAESWEALFDAAVAYKPQKGRLTGLGYLDSLVGRMCKNEMFTPEILDRMAAKMTEASDEVKVVVAKKLIDGHFKGENIEYTSLSSEQLKKIMGALEGIKTEKVTADIGVKREYDVTELLFKYNKKYFNEAAFDENFVSDLKEFFANTKLSEDVKLQLISDFEHGKFTEGAGFKHKFKIQAIRESLDFVADAKANSYTTTSYDAIWGGGNVFVLGQKLLKQITLDLSGQERIDIIDKLLVSAKRLADSGSRDHYCKSSFSSLLRDRFETRGRMFKDLTAKDNSYETISKFLDEIQAEMSKINKDFASWKPSIDLQCEYDNLLYSFKVVLDKKSFSMGYNSTKEEEIWTKVDDFGKKTFASYWRNPYHTRSSSSSGSSGWGGGSGYSGGGSSSSSGWGGSSGRSGGSSGSSGSGRTGGSGSGLSEFKKAKQTIVKYLREREELKELADLVENQEMDGKLFKSVKRKLAIIYHPDRAGRDEQLAAKNSEIFKQISAALDVIESQL